MAVFFQNDNNDRCLTIRSTVTYIQLYLTEGVQKHDTENPPTGTLQINLLNFLLPKVSALHMLRCWGCVFAHNRSYNNNITVEVFKSHKMSGSFAEQTPCSPCQIWTKK